jgi:c-di-GMP-binding flagellar brake protein YcgR
MKKERRKSARRPVVDDAYAALGKNYTRVGKIINICIGGLAFEYITGESDTHEDEKLDIFISDYHFSLYNLPCSVVYDIALRVPNLKSRIKDLLTTRRCGVRFHHLSASQRQKLQAFVDSQLER